MADEDKKGSRSLLRGTGIVSILTLVSRVFGFLEQLLMARFFGAGGFTDAFFIAFRIPNLLRSFVAEGALTSAFVPVFTEELTKSHEKAEKLLRATTTLLLIITLTLSLLGIIFAREIVALIAPGFGLDSTRGSLCIILTAIMFPYIIFVSLVAMLNGALNSVKHYGAAPLAQITMNITLIIGVIISGQFIPEKAFIILASFVILGGITQLIIQIPTLKKVKLYPIPAKNFITKETIQILKLMLPAIFGAAVYQIGVLCNSILASLLEEGSISWLFYADRLSQLPIGVFTVALASVLLPTLSRAAAEKNKADYAASLSDSLRFTSFCMIPFSALMFAFALPITVILFERGEFMRHDSEMTALAIQAMAIGLWGVSCSSMVTRGFLALKDTKTPLYLGIVSLALNLAISVILMGAVSGDTNAAQIISFIQAIFAKVGLQFNFGHVGLAFANGFAATCILLLSLFLLNRRLTGLTWKPFITAAIKTIAASALMLGCIYLTRQLFSLNSIYLKLLIESLIALLSFCFFAKILKIKEAEETFSLILRLMGITTGSRL